MTDPPAGGGRRPGHAPATTDLTIVIPAFNEAARLPEGMARLERAVADGCVDLDRTEVVVVDDGSTDDTEEVARRLLARYPHHRVERLPHNRGKGAAVRAGVALAASPAVAHVDADMAIDPHALPDLVAALATADVAIGSRSLPGSAVETTYVLRWLMGRAFNALVVGTMALGMGDTQCGFKAYRTPVARTLFHLVRIDRFAFDAGVLFAARRLGLEVAQVPVHWRNVPGSSVRPLHDARSMVVDILRSRFGLLATTPLVGFEVRCRDGARAAAGGPSLVGAVSEVLDEVLGGAPVPVVSLDASVLALLPLVEARDVRAVADALGDRREWSVLRSSVDDRALARLAPLAGRLAPVPAG